jgi:hypothetical protein
LSRVNENTHHHFSGLLPGGTNQFDMSGMQVAHGRDEADALPCLPPLPDDISQCEGVGDYFHKQAL